MNWGSAAEFFAMGGYGLYVWGSYGGMALVLAVEVALAAGRHRRAAVAALALNMHDMHELQDNRGQES